MIVMQGQVQQKAGFGETEGGGSGEGGGGGEGDKYRGVGAYSLYLFNSFL